MGLALIGSGQGGQHPAMFALLSAEQAAQPVLRAVSGRLGHDVRDLGAWQGDLHDNRTAQLLIVGQALAAHAALAARGLPSPAVLLGYSVGELAAHGCAGCFTVEDTLDLAQARAEAMDAAAAPDAALGMVGVLGLSRAVVEECARASGAALAIVNAPDHMVVGGPAAALARFEAQAAARGAHHLRRLPLATASHTPFLEAAGARFAAVLVPVRWQPAPMPLLSGLDGHAVRAAADAKAVLAGQLHRPLDWHRCLLAAAEYGATAFLELGPGRSLATMVEHTLPGTPVRALDDFRTVAGAAAWAARHAATA